MQTSDNIMEVMSYTLTSPSYDPMVHQDQTWDTFNAYKLESLVGFLLIRNVLIS
jgi:hypothetical protein